MPIPEVDRVSITTVVDNSIDSLRADEKVARRFTHARARKMPTLRAEHGLAHWVEVTRGRETRRLSFDWGLTDASYVHNLRELGLDPPAWTPSCCRTGTRTTGAGSRLPPRLPARPRPRGAALRGPGPLPAALQRAPRRPRLHRAARPRRPRPPGPRHPRGAVAHRRRRRGHAERRDAGDDAVRGDPAVAPRGAGRRGDPGHVHRGAEHVRERAGPRAGRRHVVLAPGHRGHLPARHAGHRGAARARGDRRVPPRGSRASASSRWWTSSAPSRSSTSFPSTARGWRPWSRSTVTSPPRSS